MNLLIFATGDFYTKPNPSFHLLTTLINDMLNAGIHIFFVGIEEEGLNKHIPDEFENNPNFEYSLVKAKKIKKTSFVSRYLHGIKYAYDAKKIIKKYISNTDVVFARSSPTVLFNILTVRKVSKDVKILYGIQDMFPGSTIASGKMPNKLMQKFFFCLQKKAYEKSSIITVISEDMKTKLLEQGVPEEKIRVIVNWFDDKSVREIPRKDNLFIKKYNMQRDQFYVQYAGTMGYVFDYNMVLSVARLLQEHDDIIFQMIGEGSQKTAQDVIQGRPRPDLKALSEAQAAATVPAADSTGSSIPESGTNGSDTAESARKPLIVEGCDLNAILEGLGGRQNIDTLDNCVTRLRVEVKDSGAVKDDVLKAAGAKAVVRTGANSVQVVIGLKVQKVADELRKIL